MQSDKAWRKKSELWPWLWHTLSFRPHFYLKLHLQLQRWRKFVWAQQVSTRFQCNEDQWKTSCPCWACIATGLCQLCKLWLESDFQGGRWHWKFRRTTMCDDNWSSLFSAVPLRPVILTLTHIRVHLTPVWLVSQRGVEAANRPFITNVVPLMKLIRNYYLVYWSRRISIRKAHTGMDYAQ